MKYRLLTGIVALLMLCAGLAGCAMMQKVQCTISLDDMCDSFAPNRHIMVVGTIDADRALPQDAVMEVTLSDQEGNVLRSTYSKKKDSAIFWYGCPELTGYSSEEEKISDIERHKMVELIVEDGNNPMDTICNAQIKCWYSDNYFKALLVNATDIAHGLPMDDGMNYTDANGEPYTSWPKGEYVLTASLYDSNKDLLAECRKLITIEDGKSVVMGRYSPISNLDNYMKLEEQLGISNQNDIVPGSLSFYGSSIELPKMVNCVNTSRQLNATTHGIIYNLTEDSTCMTNDLAGIQERGQTNDRASFLPYCYDIGEPEITIGGKECKGSLITMENNIELTRIDKREGGQDNFIAPGSELIEESVYRPEEEVVVDDYDIGIAGVIMPFQVNQEYIHFDSVNNYFKFSTNANMIRYTFTRGNNSIEYEKPVGVTRQYADGSLSSAVYEFYHVFSNEEVFDTAKKVKLKVELLDNNMNPIEDYQRELTLVKL
ncbi:MAG: hypothetical protein HUJ71_03070 [Pseudobutyrivibrio sp.]|nr:hypothetical protein [Pseudobutyrivibrio sp.]